MTSRVPRFIKVFEEWFTSISHYQFDATTHGVGLRLLLLARKSPDVAVGEPRWAVLPSGEPYSFKALCQMTRLPKRLLEKHVALLVRSGTVVRRDDGAFGFPGFDSWQSTLEHPEMPYSEAAPRKGYVYIAQAENGRVKIGYSVNPSARIGELRVGSSVAVEMVASFAGTIDDERRLHRKFDRCRVAGEWFSPDADMAKFITESIAAHPYQSRSSIRSKHAATRSTTTVATPPPPLVLPPSHSPPLTPHLPPELHPHSPQKTPTSQTALELVAQSVANPNPNASPAAKTGRKRGPRLPRSAVPDGLAEHVLAELQAACRELTGHPVAGPQRVTPGMLDSLAKLHAAEQPTPDEWTRVIRRRLDLSRQGDTYGALDWEHLCRAANFRRYRDHVQSGRGARQTGRAEPTSRPTQSGVVDLRARFAAKTEGT